MGISTGSRLPPPSFDELFSGFSSTLSFPIAAPQFDRATAQLKNKDPDFALDETELAHLQQFLTDRPAAEGPSPWQDRLMRVFLIAKTLGPPVIAYVALSATVPSPWYVLYGPVPLAISMVSQLVFGLAAALPEMLLGAGTTVGLIWVSLLELFLAWSAFYLARGHLSVWLSWPLLTLVISLLVIPLMAIAWILVDAAAQRRRPAVHSSSPEAYIACQLFDVFAQAALTQEVPVSPAVRRSWAWSLSNVALCLETSLTRTLATTDPSVDTQTQAELRKRSSAMRALAGRITLGGDHPLDIARSARTWVRSACYFDWQALPATETEPVKGPVGWQQWIRKAARSLTMLILPVGLLLALRRGWIVLEAGQNSWANLVLGAWIALILLSMMDPDFQFTNKMLETMNKFPLPGKSGKKE